jgi:hypothetical protein
MKPAPEKTQVFSEQKSNQRVLFPIRNKNCNNKLLANRQSVKLFYKELIKTPFTNSLKGGLA